MASFYEGMQVGIRVNLMSLFLQNQVKQSRRQIGFIIAELSSSLSLVSAEDGKEWMKTVLNHIRPGVSILLYISHAYHVVDIKHTTNRLICYA